MHLRFQSSLVFLLISISSTIFSYDPQHLAAVKDYSDRIKAEKKVGNRPDIVGNFKDFDLSEAELSGLNLEGAIFTGANFSGAKLHSCSFNRCHARNASFNGADLSSSSFKGADLKEASFVGARSFVSIVPLRSSMGSWNVSFEGANLNQANLTGAFFSYSDFKNSIMMSAQLDNADFSYSDLTGSAFDNSSLQRVNLCKASLGNVSIVDCNIQQNALTAQSVKGNPVFNNEEMIRSLAKIKYLVKRGQVNVIRIGGKSLLHVAIEIGNVSLVRYLLANNADINATDGQGETPFGLATRLGHSAIIQDLLAKGADLNGLINGRTPLHVAAQNGRSTVLRLLLQRGADKHKRDSQGRLPGCYAGNSPAIVDSLKDVVVKNQDLRFRDIAGAEDVIVRLQGIMRLFRARQKEMPAFVLFEGPPGTGKTFIAHAFANETGFNFIEQSASFNTKYHGESEAAARKLFERAIEKAPCIVFVDEIDSVAAIDRGGSDTGGGAFKAMQEVLNEFLKGLNRVADSNHRNFINPVTVIGATNFAEALDAAFKDRAEEIIHFTHPSREGRELIIRKYLQAIPVLSVGEDFSSRLAIETKGFSIRQLRKIIDMTERRAAELGSEAVREEHFVEPFDHVRREVYKRTPEQLLRPLFSLPISREEAFRSLVGMDDVIQQIDTALAFFREPERYKRVGARIPRGFLLEGPPGTGKTSIAKALAMAGGFTFFNYDGATLLSGGLPMIKQCFEDARDMSPSIIFVDEIDSLGSQRSIGTSNSPINKFLSEMQGFNSGNEPVVVIGTTNFVHSLDHALLDRFERIIHVPLPGEEARKHILQLYLSRLPLEDNSLLDETFLTNLAKRTEGLSGRSLEKLINEIAITAGNNNALAITNDHIELAIASLHRDLQYRGNKSFQILYQNKVKVVQDS